MSRALGLAILAALVGCRTPDAVLVKGAQNEVAAIGSEAKIPGPRSPEQVARIAAQVAKAQRLVAEAAK